jgi:hypothetical protein
MGDAERDRDDALSLQIEYYREMVLLRSVARGLSGGTGGCDGGRLEPRRIEPNDVFPPTQELVTCLA